MLADHGADNRLGTVWKLFLASREGHPENDCVKEEAAERYDRSESMRRDGDEGQQPLRSTPPGRSWISARARRP
jgi:hypothetical protein